MATASLQTSRTELLALIGSLASWNDTPANWDATATARAEKILRLGLQRFYHPPNHRWSFLRPEYSLITSPPQSSSTVTIVDGVATLAAGSWPSWAADGWLYIAGVPYDVSTRDSGTQLTLVNTDLDASAGTAYVLRRFRYALPAGFAGLVGPFNYAPKASNQVVEMEETAEHLIRRYYTQCYWGGSPNRQPTHYCVISGGETPTTGSLFYLAVWPAGDEAFYLTGNIYLVPQDIDDTNLYPMGGAVHAKTLIEAVLAEAELMLFDQYGSHNEAFLEALAKSIEHDKRLKSPDTLGVIPDSGDYCPARNPGDWWIYPAGFESQIIP